MSEEAIQATAVDAISCKIYAGWKKKQSWKSRKNAASVKHGYYEDEALLKLFAREADSVDRKSPEIARGTWARVLGTRQELRSFYENNINATIRRRKVVINCGAGFDTTHWWSKNEELFKTGDLWFDLDMEPVVRQRIRRLRMPGAKSLLSSLKNLKITDSQLSSDSYFIRKLDMKQSSSADVLEDIKSEFEIDEQTDVCLLFECVLVYMSTEISGSFLKFAADLFNNLKVISYEQVYIWELASATCLQKTGSETGFFAQNVDSLLDRNFQGRISDRKTDSRTGF